MAIFTYTYNKKSIANKLKQEAETALGFTVNGLDYNIGTFDIFFRFFTELTGPQITTLNQVVSDHLGVETQVEYFNSISGDTIAGNFYGDGSNLTGINNFYVTGGTYSNGTLQLNRNDETNISVNGFLTQQALSGLTDILITGTPIDDSVIIWDSNSQKWKPTTIETLIENTVSSIGLYVSNNNTTTTITSTNTPTQIQSNNFNVSFSTNFSQSSGVITYTGNTKLRLSLDATLYFTSTNNQNLNFYFGLNTGSTYQMLVNTKGPARTQGNNEITFANTKGLVEVNNGHRLAVFVENTTSTSNVIIQDMNWTINS